METLKPEMIREITGKDAFLERISALSGVEQSVVLENMRGDILPKPFKEAWFDGHARLSSQSESVQTLLGENTVQMFGPIVSKAEAEFMRVFFGIDDYTTAEGFLNDMEGIDGDVEILCNCPGGSVTETAVMRQAIQQRVAEGDHIKFNVLGMAASAASFVALDAQESVISDAGTFMIHESHMTIALWEQMGAEDIRKYMDNLDSLASWIEQTNDLMTDIYVNKTGIDRDEIVEMMRKETYLVGGKAVEKGFIDSVYSISAEKKETDAEADADAKAELTMEQKIVKIQETVKDLQSCIKDPFALQLF